MSGQIVVQDFAGWHNGNFEQSRSRILRGNTWKRQRIVMVMPAAGMIPAPVALALMNLGFPPNNAVVRVMALGLEVGEAYSRAVEGILEEPDLSQFEYMLTVEHDNLPRPNAVINLVERMEASPEFAAISGLYWQKGPGGYPQIWGDPKEEEWNCRPVAPVNGELVECQAIGMGFALWRLATFKDPKLRKPWFKTLTYPMMSQDLYVWQDLRQHGYRCAVDCSVKVGHVDAEGMIW